MNARDSDVVQKLAAALVQDFGGPRCWNERIRAAWDKSTFAHLEAATAFSSLCQGADSASRWTFEPLDHYKFCIGSSGAAHLS